MTPGLLRTHPGFRRLWTAQSITELGTQVSSLAVPLVAVVTLHASAFQASVLSALTYVPYLLIGLPAGVWIDRVRRRPILIVTNLLRAAALLSVPLAALAHVISLPLLYAVVLVTGVGTLFFEVSYQAYLPTLVGRDDLVEANSRLTLSRGAASLVGPAGAGALIAVVTAPLAIVVDVAGYLAAAATLGTIHASEPQPVPTDRRTGADVRDGLRLIVRDRLLRTLTAYSAVTSLCVMMTGAVETVFLVRTVGLSPRGMGILFACTSIGVIGGASVAGPLRRRLGDVRTLTTVALVAGVGMLIVPLTGPGPRLALFVLGVGTANCAIVAYNVVSVALTQRRCPDAMTGRVFATLRVSSWSTVPVGALLGGAIGQHAGTREAMWVSGAIFLAAAVASAVALRSGVSTEPLVPPDAERLELPEAERLGLPDAEPLAPLGVEPLRPAPVEAAPTAATETGV